jgi:hypothetical protein
MNNVNLNIIRFDSTNHNTEALKGQYAQYSDGQGVFTIIKNVLFIQLLNGASYNELRLPVVYDGFLICSDGNRIEIKDSTLTCELTKDVNAQGQLILKKWN